MIQYSGYQNDIFSFGENGRGHGVVEAAAGCLAGGTLLEINRGGKSYKTTIAQLHHMLSGGMCGTRRFNLSIPTTIRSLSPDGSTIRLNKIAVSVYSGQKLTYTITTKSGKSLRATAEHRFLTAGGWVKLGDLRPGDSVLVDGGRPARGSRPKKYYEYAYGLGAHPFCVKKGRGRGESVAKHRIIYEAHLNNMGYQQFVARVRSGQIEGLAFVNPATHTIHHKDENPRNNSLDNLMLMSREDHYSHHAKNGGWKNVQAKAVLSQVESIEVYGVEPTFDLTMADEGNPNFLANGFVVHNSGKTSTLVELARRLSAKNRSANIIFLAFNKHIADELSTRLAGTNASARTIHSVGNSAVTGSVGRTTIDARKYNTLAQEWVDRNILRFPEDERKDAAAEVPGVLAKLVNFARLTLVDAKDFAALDAMCLHFDIEVAYPSLLFAALPTILEQGKEAARNKKIIDFTDMIWLPVALNLTLQKFDFILVDEAQDENACQLELVLKMCGPKSRVFFVGDRSQSIMGFSGSDNRSIEKIIARTQATTLPLSICYRCPASHIRLAQMVVPSIEARPDAPEGEIVFAKNEDDLQKMVQASDLIICRLTAPLIKECIKLIKNKVSARVRGRDIGKDLVSLLKKVGKMADFSYDKVVAFLESYRALQEDFLRQKKADESMIESLNDRVSCLQVCAESFLDAKSINQLSAEIEALFDDNRPAVWLSTIHRAKGLEADRVFILRPEKLPLRWKNQQAWSYEQELNLLYVALTRAKRTLVFLGDLPDPCQQESEVKPEREALEAAQDAFTLEAEACIALEPIASPVTAQDAQRLDMTRLAEAIAALDALVHDKLAMYKTDKVREAAEEVKRQFELMQRREVIAEKEVSHDCVDPVCPICGKKLQQEEEFLYCPEHGGPLSALIDRQQQREAEWAKEGR